APTAPRCFQQPGLVEIGPPRSRGGSLLVGGGRGENNPRPLAAGGQGRVPGTSTCIVWASRRNQDAHAVAAARQATLDENEHEYRRLLYVAMTRAAERLIVCGCHGKKKPQPGCWYDLVRKGLEGQPEFEGIVDGESVKWRYGKAVHPPLKGQGRTAEGGPEWGGSGAVNDSDAVSAETLSPPCGPLAQADLPPTEPRYGEGSATRQSDRSRQQPTSAGG